jgi:hypothetical protein
MSNSTAKQKRNDSFKSTFKRFLQNNAGVSAMMTAITLPVVLLAGGVAIDAAVIAREQPIFYQAVDNAALAVAANELSIIPDSFTEAQKAQRKEEMRVYAMKFFKSNYHGTVDDMSTLDLTVGLTGQRVDIDAKLEVPMTVTSLFGIEKTILRSDATVMRAMRPIEIAFVLDTTGSMKDDMGALKTAANKMLATLYSDASPTSKNMTSPFIRTSLVPFSAAVRLDPNGHEFDMGWFDTTGVNPLSHLNFSDPTWHNFMAWNRLRSTAISPNPPMEWNGCVESRTARALDGTNYITSDIEPGLSNPESLFPVYFNPDSPSWYTSSSSNFNRYKTSSGSSPINGNWNNQYIHASRDWNATNHSSTLAPLGANRTGFDDSTIGNNVISLATRWKNVAKYDGKAIAPETFTASGSGWVQNKGPWYNCTASAVVPITHQRAKIEAGITAMKAAGNTNIAEGLAWGMRTISPGAPFTQVEGASGIADEAISPYNGPRWQKIVLLMSDGENTTGSGYTDTGSLYSSYGATNTPTAGNLNRYMTNNTNLAQDALDANTSAMCNNLKSNNVTIYAVGFRLDNPVLKNCATSPAHYKFASTTDELVAYFDGIGRDVLNKMVYIAN